ncbi:glycosyltransferase [Candidatus Pelagibacter sp.]|nr:glycosyltransferase [Candidatus Pelagibacter sp.]
MIKSDISIILLLYNTPSEKIQNLLNYKNFNIFILDQSNDYNTKKIINKLLPNIKYYKVTKHNNGFAKSINFLAKKVKTKFFLCTQIDVLINSKSIMELKRAFIDNNDCAISIPNFTNYKKLKKKIKTTTIVKNFIGAIFLADKDKFNQIGAFDENFFFYWEDIDFSKRIENLKKFKIYKCKNSYAKHLYGKSTINNNKSKFIRLSNFKFGEYLFQYKYKKLKKIKIIREPLVRIFLLLISIISLNKTKFYKNLYFLIGIIKFYKFLCFKS